MHRLSRPPATRSLLIGLFLALPFWSSAQEYLEPIEGEHRSIYTVGNTMEPAVWKVLHEALKGFDPLLRAVYDPEEQTVKVLAYRPVDSEEVVRLAEQLGIGLALARIVDDGSAINGERE